MTNSAPKMNNKVERQGSPNSGGKQRHYHRSNTVKSATFLHSGNRHGRKSAGRLSCSPPCSTTKSTRNSPLRCESSPRGSPTNSFYAGAKFSSKPPSPASLPKPPSHWTTRLMSTCQQSDRTCDISNHLKMLLNVRA